MMDHGNSPLQGAAWMVLSTLAMVGVNGVIKHIGPGLPVAQAAFLRFAFSFVLFLPMLRPVLAAHYPPRIWGLFVLRGGFHVIAVLLWFYAMARVPVAEMSAIGFLNPVLVLVIGGLVLGEGLGLRRLSVAAAAFLGALIILRPGLREITPGHWSQLAASLCFAMTYLVAKRLSALVSAGVVVATMTFTVTLGLLPLALLEWQPVTLWQLTWLAVAAVLATIGHYAMSRAFAAAPLAVTQPVAFLQILWAAALGALVFAEPIDPMVILGGGIIISALSLNLRAEAVAAKRAAPARRRDPV